MAVPDDMTISFAILVFVLAGGLSTGLIWSLLKAHSRLLASDIPNQRSLHQNSTPRGAGLAIAITVGAVALAASLYFPVRPAALGIAGVLIGAALLGFLDDHLSLSVRLRIAVGILLSVITAFLTIFSETWVLFGQLFYFPKAFVVLPIALCLFWTKNLVNFMDGADGLVGVHSLLINMVLSYWFWLHGGSGLALLCMANAGATFGFLVFNWAPAKVFLGDSGSLFLGAWLGVSMVLGANHYGIPVEAFLVLGGFLFFDSTFTLFRRMLMGRNLLSAHREHLYQRLVLSGWSHSSVAVATGILTCLMALIANVIVTRPELGSWLFLSATAILALFGGYVVAKGKTRPAQ